MKSNKEFHTVRGYQLLNENKKITSAMEDYLEMIYRHTQKDGYIRINKLSELLNVAASSATKMVQNLGKLGLVNYKKYGIVSLSKEGNIQGKALLERHKIIEAFLKRFGNNKNYFTETELIEHHISKVTLKNLHLLNRFFELNPDIMNKFENFKRDIN